MTLKDKMKTYNFWISLVSAVLLIVRIIGDKYGFSVDSGLVMDITTGVCGIFVILGIISAPQKNQEIKNGVGGEVVENTQKNTVVGRYQKLLQENFEKMQNKENKTENNVLNSENNTNIIEIDNPPAVKDERDFVIELQDVNINEVKDFEVRCDALKLDLESTEKSASVDNKVVDVINKDESDVVDSLETNCESNNVLSNQSNDADNKIDCDEAGDDAVEYNSLNCDEAGSSIASDNEVNSDSDNDFVDMIKDLNDDEKIKLMKALIKNQS